MQFNPALTAGPADDRGGTLTGWFLPDGAIAEPPHEHSLESCDLPGCSNDVTVDDGTYCSPECRLEAVRTLA